MSSLLLPPPLEDAFSDDARRYGDELVSAGLVRLDDAAPPLRTGRVFGQRAHQVSLRLGTDGYQAECDCAEAGNGIPCRHLWALHRAVEDQETTPEIEVEHAFDWERSLDEVDARFEADAHTLLLYFLHLDDHPPCAHLRLELRATAPGDEAGRGHPISGSTLGAEVLQDRADLEIFGALRGAIRGDRKAPRPAGAEGYALDGPQLRLLFPRLAASGRCRIEREDPRDAVPLRWSERPYQLGLALRRPRDGEHIVLSGFVERDERRVPLRELLLLSPGVVLTATGEAAPLEDRGAFRWVELLRYENLRAPRSDEARLVERLLLMQRLPLLDLPGLEATATIRPRPLLKLEAVEVEDAEDEVTIATLAFDYDGLLAAACDRAGVLRRPLGTRVLRRDPATEEELLDRLARAFPDIAREQWFAERPDARPRLEGDELPDRIRALIQDGFRVELGGRRLVLPTRLDIDLEEKADWLDLTVALRFEDEDASFPRLLDGLGACGTLPLPSGALGLLPATWVRRFPLLSELAEPIDKTLRLHASRGFFLDALLLADEGVPTELDEAARSWRERWSAGARPQPLAEPEGFQGSLRPYQRQALGWFRFLRTNRLGGCLADEMGLGKTVQILASLLDRRQQARGCAPFLVVAPSSLVFNWVAEAQRFAPDLRARPWIRSDGLAALTALEPGELLVTSYAHLRLGIEELRSLEFDTLVLDEAQAIKNAGSQTFKAASLLRSRQRIALSGTPLENHPGELAALFSFLVPGLFDRLSPWRGLVRKRSAAKSEDEGDDLERLQELGRALRPLILRRTKRDVAPELPPRLEDRVLVELSDSERRDYDELRDHLRATLLAPGVDRDPFELLEGLLRLRQAACHPGLVDPRRVRESSAKLDLLLDRLQELHEGGHQTLVFSQFTRFLDIVEERTKNLGLPLVRLDGRTKDRRAPVEAFQNGEASIFLISLKAGGVGLNLTAADHVFLLDPWWNPAAERQATDRAWRIGQTRPVQVLRLVARDTVEEKIVALQARKALIAEMLLEEAAPRLAAVDLRELAALIEE